MLASSEVSFPGPLDKSPPDTSIRRSSSGTISAGFESLSSAFSGDAAKIESNSSSSPKRDEKSLMGAWTLSADESKIIGLNSLAAESSKPTSGSGEFCDSTGSGRGSDSLAESSSE